MSPSENKKKEEENSLRIVDIKIDPLTKKQFRKKVVYFLKDGNQHYITTVNAEFLMTAKEDSQFKKILNSADISLADGNGVILANYFMLLPVSIPKTFSFKKQKAYRKRKIRNQLIFSLLLNLFYPRGVKKDIPEKLSGADVVLDICKIISENDLSLYLLGGGKETSVGAKFMLEKMFPDLIISGIKGGFNKEAISSEMLVESVNKAKPDVLFVALGHPYQEKWIYQNLDKLPSVKLAIGVGGSLDFLSGRKKRAPQIMQKINLEWLFRFIQEPSRSKRIKRAVIDFPKMLYREKVEMFEREEEGQNNVVGEEEEENNF